MLSIKVSGYLALAVLLAPLGVGANCECGYSVNSTNDSTFQVFTDVLESDFSTLPNITQDTDWVIQHWAINKAASKGPYGRRTELRNVISNPIKEANSTTGTLGGEAGLELWVRKVQPGDEYVSVAEVDTVRTDMLYGTFRAGIRTTPINGTCAAFFWYLNDTQEIDMEFLSAQMNSNSSPVNLVLHSTLSEIDGGDAKNTPTFKVVPLPFQPTDGFHEYRFDWKPGSVTFYGDGEWLLEFDNPSFVPSVPGKIILSHWSNGQPLWSGGPPAEDAVMLISYFKAYFNSTDKARIADHNTRCPDPSVTDGICQIPDQIGEPRSGQVPFFYQDPSRNMTNNQTIYGSTSASTARVLTVSWTLLVSILALLVFWGP